MKQNMYTTSVSFFIFFCLKSVLSISKYPILIVVSYDGFRYDFISKDLTPNIRKLRQSSTYTEYMQSVFPTKTFPNHQSIATGLYAESHGVVGNQYYDPELKTINHYGPDMYRNPKVEPIWITNEKAAVGRYSGVMMWPGSAFEYQDRKPFFIRPWDPSLKWESAVDEMISWITHPKHPANLVMFYVAEPDTHAHIYGPNSHEVKEQIQKLDNLTMYMEIKLKEHGLKGKANIVHLSDHGMTSVSLPYIIDLREYIKEGTYVSAGTSPVVHIFPSKGTTTDTYKSLTKGAKKNGHFTVFLKKDIPARWNIKNSPRVGDIVVIADVGYAFQDLQQYVEEYASKYKIQLLDTTKFGIHGYDYSVPDMRAFFMARGPHFRKNYRVPPFKNVDLYNVFCHILKIKPLKNNGSMFVIPDLITSPHHNNVVTTVITIVGGVLIALMLVVCAVIVTIATIKRQQNITTAAALNKRFQQNHVEHSSIEVKHLLESEEA